MNLVDSLRGELDDSLELLREGEGMARLIEMEQEYTSKNQKISLTDKPNREIDCSLQNTLDLVRILRLFPLIHF